MTALGLSENVSVIASIVMGGSFGFGLSALIRSFLDHDLNEVFEEVDRLIVVRDDIRLVVPFEDIKKVTYVMVSPQEVRFHLFQPTILGQEIAFIPNVWLGGYPSFVKQLRARIEAARVPRGLPKSGQ